MTVASLAILVPLLAAALVAGVRTSIGRAAGEALAVTAAAATAALCAVLVVRAGGPLDVLWLGGWAPVDGMPVGIALTPDVMGGGMALFSALLAVVALVSSRRLTEAADPLFHALVLVLLAAMVGFCLGADLFTLFVFFELMSVCAYALVALRSAEPSPLQGGVNFAITNSLGAILLLFGVGLLYGRTGALNLARIGDVLSAQGPPDALVVVAFALVAGGLLVKAAVVPFHFWLADAYAAASSPVCLLLAGAFTELGLFGLVRVYWNVFAEPFAGHEGAVRVVFVVLGLATALVGAMMALEQRHLRRMLAFATTSTIGISLAAIGLLEAHALAGAMVWALADGCAKAALFVGVGALERRFGTIDAGELHGRGRDMPFTGAAFAVAGLAIAGLPPLGPFWGKGLVDHGAELVPGFAWLPWAIAVPSLLIGAAVLRAGAGVFVGIGEPPRLDPSTREAREEPEPPEGRDPILTAATLLLTLAAVGLGAAPGLLDATLTAAAATLDTEAVHAAVLFGAQVTPAELGAPSPSALAWAVGILSACAAAVVAWIALLGAAGSHAPGPARSAMRAMRDLHSGHVGDYVLWLAAGFVALGGALLAGLT